MIISCFFFFYVLVFSVLGLDFWSCNGSTVHVRPHATNWQFSPPMQPNVEIACDGATELVSLSHGHATGDTFHVR